MEIPPQERLFDGDRYRLATMAEVVRGQDDPDYRLFLRIIDGEWWIRVS